MPQNRFDPFFGHIIQKNVVFIFSGPRQNKNFLRSSDPHYFLLLGRCYLPKKCELSVIWGGTDF